MTPGYPPKLRGIGRLGALFNNRRAQEKPARLICRDEARKQTVLSLGVVTLRIDDETYFQWWRRWQWARHPARLAWRRLTAGVRADAFRRGQLTGRASGYRDGWAAAFMAINQELEARRD